MTIMIHTQQAGVTEPGIPSFDVFREEVKKIYPEGDLIKSYDRIKWYIEHEKVCTDGSPLTYKLIMDKFAAHIRSWNSQYGEREAKYRGKDADEKRKTIWDFVGMRWYEREFVIPSGNGERNKYLFGNFSISYLLQKLEEFKNRFPDETD